MKASFRDYVNTLRRNDELLEISKPVDLRDIAALVAQSEKALLFKNLSGYSMPVVSGLLQSRNRIALGMGVEYENIADKLGKAMDKPIKPKRVANAPVKEVIHTGKKVNLYDLPVPVFSIMDGGPMITGGVVIAEDPEFGINAGIYRLDAQRKKYHRHRYRDAEQHAQVRRARAREKEAVADFYFDRHPSLRIGRFHF